MKTNVVLLLEGGGALGAFQCGAWKALAPFLREENAELAVIAGASIGAVNGALIARHYQEPDRAAARLERFWREKLAMPPLPFFPAVSDYWQAWNGLLSALWFGNRSLFLPNYPYWTLPAEAFRMQQSIYRTDAAQALLATEFGAYAGEEPLLVVNATNVRTGASTLFDSASRPVTPRMIVASMSIPILFPPTEVDGEQYWDGEIRSNTLLPDVLDLMHARQAGGQGDAKLGRTLVIVVGMLRADTGKLPSSSLEASYRLMNILLGAKLSYDERAVAFGNRYLEFAERTAHLAAAEPGSPLAEAVQAEHRKLVAEGRSQVEVLHIGREQFPFEHVSRDFNYSPDYIDRLIRQGFQNASQAVEAYRAARHAPSGQPQDRRTTQDPRNALQALTSQQGPAVR